LYIGEGKNMFNSIRSRVIGATAGIVIIALLINTVVNYLIINKFNNRAVESSLTALTQSHTATITQWVSTQKGMIASLVPHVTDSDPVPLLKQIADAGHFMNVDIGYPDKRDISSDPSGIPEGYDPTSRPWYIQAVQAGKPLVINPYMDVTTKKLIVTVAAPRIENGTVLGVVEGDIRMDDVIANIRNIKPTPDSFGMLIAADGTIMAHPDDALTLKTLADIAPGLDSAALLKGGIVQTDMHGLVKLLKALPVGDSGWYTVVVMDKAEATAGMRSLLTASAICLLCLIVFAVLVVNFISQRALAPLNHIRVAMDNIASGNADLTQRLDASRNDEVAAIARAFNTFIATLSGVMVSIMQTSHAVRDASQEIALGNQDLSSRTESAAASLQQTSAAMEQISSTVSLTAEMAEQANEAIAQTAQAANEGGAAVKSVIHAIGDIESASGKIADITGVIESIAFQSNILALNASVEAARAGEMGKGFAVVAGEVRNLASRSTQAAQEIKVLIDSTLESIRVGSRQVAHTGKTMDHIVGGVKSVTTMMAEITNATREQQRGIQEINLAVTQLDAMVQQNAALVEESTTASAAVQGQARELADAVGQFRV